MTTTMTTNKPRKVGPVLGGVRRAPRGPIFKLFFAGGYHRFYPAKAGVPWYARIIYYARVVLAVTFSGLRPSNMIWLLRWVFTVAVLIYLVVAVVVLAGALLGVPGWGS